MHKTVALITVCAVFTTILAVPTKNVEWHTTAKRLSYGHAYHTKEFAVKNEPMVRSAIQLQHLSTLYVRDFFADLIRATLDMSVKELLVKVETTFEELERVTDEGLEQLKLVFEIASPEIQEELAAIQNSAIDQVMAIIDEFLSDLGSVLPALTFKYSTHDSASDIIYALLGKTLEELVTAIANALNNSVRLLNNTIRSFIDLASRAKPEVASALNKISDQYLNRGKSIVIPMLDQLEQLVPVDIHDVPKQRIKLSKSQQYGDLLDGIISSMSGTNITEAALEADTALSQLIPLIETTRSNLLDALEGGNDNADNKVQAKVLAIYDKAIDDVIRDIRPILTVIFQFQESSRREKTFVYDLAANLLGIGLEPLKSYIQNATKRIERTVNIASIKIITSSAQAGFSPVVKVSTILSQNLKSARTIIKPLSDILKSIVEHKESLDKSDQSLQKIVGENEWSESEGYSYNRDAIINSASELLGFEISKATQILKVSLENLDELMQVGLDELQVILTNSDPTLRSDILGIMNETLTTIHITLQPMLDVLLPFLPDNVRPNKQIALDIYVAINGVNLEKFLSYCSFVAKKVPEITELATIRIKVRAARAGPTIHGKISSLLRTSDYHTRAIIQPFIEILGPVISPR